VITDITVACSLTDHELRRRREQLLDGTARAFTGSVELDSGFRFTFSLSGVSFQQMSKII
jgi:hypothetical protein